MVNMKPYNLIFMFSPCSCIITFLGFMTLKTEMLVDPGRWTIQGISSLSTRGNFRYVGLQENNYLEVIVS